MPKKQLKLQQQMKVVFHLHDFDIFYNLQKS